MRGTVIILLLVPTILFSQLANVSNFWKQTQTKADQFYENDLYSEALNQYLTLIENGNEDPYVYLKAARTYTKLRKPYQAAEYYYLPIEGSLNLDYENQDLFNYADALLSRGDTAAAKRWFKEYFELTGDESGKKRMEGIEQWHVIGSDVDGAYVEKAEVSGRFSDIGLREFRNGFVFASKVDQSWPVDNEYLMGDLITYGLYYTEYKKDSMKFTRPVEINTQSNLFNITSPAFVGDSMVIVSAIRPKPIRLDKEASKVPQLYLGSIKNDLTWRSFKPLLINMENVPMLTPTISQGGDTLVFAAQDPKGKGGFDLYVSTWKYNRWSNPENLGPNINTTGDELSPHFYEGRLFFASNGHAGLGGLDVFYTNLEGDRAVYNMGSPVNSTTDDFDLIVTGNMEGYFSSNRNDNGSKDDIYVFGTSLRQVITANFVVDQKWDGGLVSNAQILIRELGSPGEPSSYRTKSNGESLIQLNKNTSYVVEVGKEGMIGTSDTIFVDDNTTSITYTLDKVFLFKGIVFNSSNQKKITRPTIRIMDPSGSLDSIQANQNGYFEIERISGSVLALEISKDGFLSSVDTISFDRPEFSKTIYLEEVEAFETITLSDLLYDNDQYLLKEDHIPTLDSVAENLNEFPNTHILIISHTDSKGTFDYNMELSQKRAESVQHYLESLGVATSRINSMGKGEMELLNRCKDDVECTEEEHRVNRRTEILIFHDEE